ncbi:glycosyltransferase [Mycobacterium sp. 852014-50255_SCH5639931]|uniref:glycosyltransferase n=1 Tax=Mycobacterium sp. 852014-50255_SCH5639931 TaxID=1834112 RepID=UPI0007FC0FAD|nr:glycosyltransferase [Mycobacterium sp. 852014-50255_SCH5639931]OBB68995.1 glycosyltransferase [Mycobacterium sp. 852014-50255_SCH5639931]
MRFVLATLGTRGDIEPCAAIGRELQRRGHDVRMAVPPNYIGFIESAGLAAVAHGPDQVRQNSDLERKYGTMPSPVLMAWEIFRDLTQLWPELGKALTSLADGADLLLTDASEQGLAANVAEYYDIPQAAVHIYPIPPGTHSRITRDAEDVQRRTLGLPEEMGPSTRQPLELQAYDELFFPGLAAQWAEHGLRRPFVGGLTLELPTQVDDEVSSWIAAGTPPIYFGFGSSARVASPGDVITMISGACAQLGERALICSGVSDLNKLRDSAHVKVVSAVNHSAVFPSCRAVVHHGGPGTTFAGIRAGVPTLALAVSVDQPMWAAAVNQLEVGIGRRFDETTLQSLVADLRSILTPHCITRTQEVAAQMSTPAESAATAADLLEDAVRVGPLANRQTPLTAD